MTRIKHSFIAFALIVIILPLLFFAFPIPTHAAASITLDPASGTVGTFVSISGEGFVGKLANILWDEQVIATDVPVSETGELIYSFKVPPASKGNHFIQVTDDSHWDASTASSTFTVLVQIKVSPSIGREWTSTTIIGKSFVPFEKEIKITWDGIILVGITATADRFGNWSANIGIPETTKGEHLIGAFGSSTDATEVGEVTFIIVPVASLEPISGPVGTEITISGIGFRIGEDGISITYDGELIKYNIVAESDGNWSTTLNIPPSTRGRHTIGVYGSSFTPKGIVPDINFEITPQIQLQPASGKVGSEVTVTGTGFTMDESVTISFDALKIDTATTIADNTGSFSTILEVPQGQNEEPIVTATGNSGNSAEANFTTEKSPPSAPQLLSPPEGDKLAIFTSIGDVFSGTTKYLIRIFDRSKQVYTTTSAIFDWSDAIEPENVSYAFQLVPTEDFALPTLIEEELRNSEYVLSGDDILAPGTYSWSAKTMDNAGNESSWSEARQVEVIPASTKTIILSIAIVVLCIAAFVLFAWRVNTLRRLM